MFTVAVCFFLGVLIFLQLGTVPISAILLLSPLCIWLLFRSCYIRCVAICLLAFLWTTFHAQQAQQNNLDPTLEGKTVYVCGTVSGLPAHNNKRSRLDFSVEQASLGADTLIAFPDKIRLNWYSPPERIAAGQGWCLFVRLKRPYGFMNPGGFDYERWLFQQKIRATGYVLPRQQHRKLSSGQWYQYQHLREKLRQKLEQKHVSPLVLALVLGDRSQLSTADWETLQITGTGHLLAISGLHISLIATFCFIIFRWLMALTLSRFICCPAQYVGAAAAVIAAILYAGLAGFSIPTQRALLMIVVVLAAILSRRNLHPFDVYGAALMMVLIFDPFAPLAVGFWLSFTAVFIILCITNKRINRTHGLKAGFRVQYFISFGLFPLLLVLFGQVPSLSLVSNTFAIPWVSIVTLPTALLGTVSTLLGLDVAAVFFLLCDKSILVFWWLMEYLASIPYARITWPVLPLNLLFLAILAVAIMLLPKGLMSGKIIPLLLLPLFFYQIPRPAHSDMLVTVLDVGQGLAVLVETENHTLLYDTGPGFSEQFNAGSAVILPFLRDRDIDHLDVVIQSHGDLDHIGGLSAVLEAIPVTKIYTSVPEALPMHAPERCRAGQAWSWDGVEFTVLHPPADARIVGNNGSCVLKVSNSMTSLLLPGDIEKSAEQQLMKYNRAALAADILLAPHHGSKTSSSTEFIQAVAAKYVIFPVGYRNRFKFPKQDIISRYQKTDAVLLNSAVSGAISFSIKGETIEMTQHRQIQRRFWHTKARW